MNSWAEGRILNDFYKISLNELDKIHPETLDEIRICICCDQSKPDILRVLSNIYKSLKPEGKLCITTSGIDEVKILQSNEPYELFQMEMEEWTKERITLAWLKKSLNIAGFLIIKQQSEAILIAHKESTKSAHQIPEVSITIPAYKSCHFAEALISAMGQSYLNKEIIVSDEGVDKKIEEIVRELVNLYPHIRVKYIRHKEPLGELKNFEFCRSVARGKYLKYLNDDDFLDPNCVKTFVGYLEAFYNSVTLISSQRQVIDQYGQKMIKFPLSFIPLISFNSYIYGKDAIEHNLNNNMNQIGEPSVVMFRREDTDQNLTVFKDENYWCSYDMVLNFKLLLKGNLIYLVEPLSLYRMHESQVSCNKGGLIHAAKTWSHMILAAKHRWGLFDDQSLYKTALLRTLNTIRFVKNKLDQADASVLQPYEIKIEKEILELDPMLSGKIKCLDRFFRLDFN